CSRATRFANRSQRCCWWALPPPPPARSALPLAARLRGRRLGPVPSRSPEAPHASFSRESRSSPSFSPLCAPLRGALFIQSAALRRLFLKPTVARKNALLTNRS